MLLNLSNEGMLSLEKLFLPFFSAFSPLSLPDVSSPCSVFFLTIIFNLDFALIGLLGNPDFWKHLKAKEFSSKYYMGGDNLKDYVWWAFYFCPF